MEFRSDGQVMAALYEIAEKAVCAGDRRRAAEQVLEIFSSHLSMTKGAICQTDASGNGFTVLAARGTTEEELLRRKGSFYWVADPERRERKTLIAVDRLGDTSPAGEGANLGQQLRRHVMAWMEPMDAARTLKRSDIFDRIIGEVEKIVIGAALEKTGHVQTRAARFLGINRNTLSKKVRQYGLKKKGE